VIGTRTPRYIWLAVGIAVALVAESVAPAGARAPSFAATAGCQEHQAFVDGDEAAVAARLPKRYTPVRDPLSGRPLLFVRALRCRGVTLDGRTAPATMASFGVVVQSPDGKGCASSAPVLGTVKGDVPPACNWYTLFWLADDRRVVDWLRDGTPGFPAVYVPQLVFRLGAFDATRGGAPFHFRAPAPAPSPFTIDELARERPGEIPVRGGYWVDTPQGTVKLAFSTYDLTSGDATGVVHPAHGSQMAGLFGADQRSYVAGYSLVAAERWAHAAYRKQLLWSSERTDSFAGSCSLQGTDTFSPPATNTRQPLDVRYDASGTCSGTLDGRRISNAPVKLRQTGRSDGSCPYARTNAPGQGSIGFADGTTIRYTFDFTSLLTEVDLTMYGERSGSASAPATFLTSRAQPDVALKCAGEGAAKVPMDMKISTDSPLVSKRRAGPRRRRSASCRRPSGARLRLSVRPRHVRAGRRTAFRFRASCKGHPVRGATVRFAHHRRRTRRRGGATIVARLKHGGRYLARVSRRHLRPGRVVVKAR
jgi:hypothetical protein